MATKSPLEAEGEEDAELRPELPGVVHLELAQLLLEVLGGDVPKQPGQELERTLQRELDRLAQGGAVAAGRRRRSPRRLHLRRVVAELRPEQQEPPPTAERLAVLAGSKLARQQRQQCCSDRNPDNTKRQLIDPVGVIQKRDGPGRQKRGDYDINQ